MRKVSKGQMKAKMLEYFREVEVTGEPLIVTDRGREVLEVRPLSRRGATIAEVLAEFRGITTPSREIDEEELITPLPPDAWEALRDDDRNPW